MKCKKRKFTISKISISEIRKMTRIRKNFEYLDPNFLFRHFILFADRRPYFLEKTKPLYHGWDLLKGECFERVLQVVVVRISDLHL